MKKIFTLTALIWFTYSMYAQTGNVGIGTSTPDASSKMDISATNKGLLIPRVALTGTSDASTITTPATSLLVYNTATAGVSPNNVTPGYYYNSGTSASPVWTRLSTSNSTVDWLKATTSSTAATSTDNQYVTANVGIGDFSGSTPGANLQVIGNGIVGATTNSITGTNSFAVGTSNTISGSNSIAIGNGNIVLGANSYAIGTGSRAELDHSMVAGYTDTSTASSTGVYGYGNKVSGFTGFATGDHNKVRGQNAFSSGYDNIAIGDGSIAAGQHNTAASYTEAVFGSYGTNYTALNTSSFNTADRLFNIGNGTSTAARSDALSIYKNGNIGISNSNPDASAILDISSASKGVRLPNVTLTGTTDATTITTPSTSLLVYNTATAGTSPNNVIPGYYYNSNTNSSPIWTRLNTSTTADTLGWTKALTTSTKATKTDNQYITGNVGVGDFSGESPYSKLDIKGNTLIRGGIFYSPNTPASALEIYAGRLYDGSYYPNQNYADIAFQGSGSGGGYRNFITSRHDAAINSSKNSIDFYLNNSGTSTASTGLSNTGVLSAGSIHGMSITAIGTGIGTNAPAMKLDVISTSTTANDATIRGQATGVTSNVVNGISGSTVSTGSGAAGVVGTANGAAQVYGTLGTTSSNTTNASGVRGFASGTTGANNGVWGESASSAGSGVYGLATNANGDGIYGYNNAASGTGTGTGVYGESAQSGGAGVWGTTTNTSGKGVYGNSSGGYGVYGNTSTGFGVYGEAYGNNGWGVVGLNTSTNTGTQQYGIYGEKSGNTGTGTGYAIYGDASGTGTANYGAFLKASGATNNYALSLGGSTSGQLNISPAAATTTYSLTLPSAVATVAGSVLTSSTSGVTSWTDPATIGVRWNAITAPNGNLSLAHGANTTAFTFNSVTTGAAFDVASSSLTSGSLFTLTGTNTTTTGNLFRISSSSTAAAINGLARFNFTGAHTGNGLQIDDITTTGAAAAINANAATTGIGLSINSNALTTGAALNLSSTSTAGNASKVLNITRSGANGTASVTNYGQFTAITNTGTTSTNVGGYFSASGATNNYALIIPPGGGSVGIGTSTPSYDVALGTGTSKTMGSERSTTSGTPYDLSVIAGGGSSGNSNQHGGDLILSAGICTGNGSTGGGGVSNPGSAVIFKTATPLGSSSSADQTPSEKMRIKGDGTVNITGLAGTGNRRVFVDANGNLSTASTNILTSVNNTTGTTSSANTSATVIAAGSTMTVAVGDVIIINASVTLRLTTGSNTDDFYVRVTPGGTAALTYSTTTTTPQNLLYRPDEGTGDHDDYRPISYLEYGTVTTAGSLTYALTAQNTGDDQWEYSQAVMVVRKE